MQWVDTHAHLFHEDFAKDIQEVLTQSAQAGICAIYLPSLDSKSIDAMYHLVQQQSLPYCYAALGLHPCYVKKETYAQELNILEEKFKIFEISAIGETGLDTYYDTQSLSLQEEVLEHHMAWARKYKKPLILHSRGTTKHLINILQREDVPQKGVFHCFSGTYEDAVKIIDLGFYLGIGGILTYKSSSALREIVRKLPLQALVLETDAPYLAPAGAVTRRNQPAFLPLIGKLLSKCLKTTPAHIAEVTTNNAKRLFSSSYP